MVFGSARVQDERVVRWIGEFLGEAAAFFKTE